MSTDRFNTAEARGIEEAIYQAVAEEIASGVRRDGLWAKAIAETGGSIDAAKARYIQLRAQSLIDETALFKRAKQEELQRRRADEQIKERQERQAQATEEKRQMALRIGKTAGSTARTLITAFTWLVAISTGLSVLSTLPDLVAGKFDIAPIALINGGVFWLCLKVIRGSR